MQRSDLFMKIYTLLTRYDLKVVSAVAIFVIGRWAEKGITRRIERLMVKRKVDETLVSLVSNLGYVALPAFVIIAALNSLGILTASFIAVIGAAGLAVGLALQGSLSNFAAGILTITFRPFKVGDCIEGAGVAGTGGSDSDFYHPIENPRQQDHRHPPFQNFQRQYRDLFHQKDTACRSGLR
jgi:small conductance mechanosensitive channel